MFRFVRNPDPRKKPPYGSRIDPTHPLAQGLVGCWLFNEGGGNKVFDLAKNQHCLFEGSNIYWQSDSVYIGSGSRALASDASYIPSQPPFTVVTRALGTTSQGSCAICSTRVTADNVGWSLKWEQYSNTGKVGFTKHAKVDLTSNFYSPSKTSVISAIIYQDNTVRIGVNTDFDFINDTQSLLDGPGFAIGATKNAGGGITDELYGPIYFCYLFNVALSTDVICQIYAEPYSFILVPQYWYMVDFGAVEGGEIVVSDSGSGSDSLSQIAVSLALSDSGAGIDSLPNLQASFGLSDQGTGIDSLSQLLAALSIGDSGAGADILSPMSVSTSVSDIGAASDSISSLTITLSVSDAGTGIDVISVLKELLKTISDSGIASDIVSSIAVNVAIPDSASGQDSIYSISATLVLSDTASGLDAITVLKELLKQVADSGLGSDSVFSLNVSFAVSDTGKGSDVLSSISVKIPISDFGSAVDAISVLTEIIKSISDSGQGTDALSSISVNLDITDSVTGTDSVGIEVALTVSDTATSAEVIAIAKTALKVIADSGVGLDILSSVIVNVPVKDYGQGLDLITQITTILSIIDLGVATDVILRYDTAVKLVSISFRLKKSNIEFGLRTNEIEFKLYT